MHAYSKANRVIGNVVRSTEVKYLSKSTSKWEFFT